MTELVPQQLLDLSADPADLTRQLCDIESVSGAEKMIADQIETALAGLRRYRILRVGNTIIARTTGRTADRIILAGHIDTVPLSADRNLPTWTEGAGSGQRIYGRGTADMKGGVAVQLSVAAALLNPRCGVTFIFYDGEEIAAEHNGLLRLSQSHPELLEADFAILLEPTSAAVEGGCNGTMRADIRIPGVAAHSARSWMGKNAIHDAAGLLAQLRDWPTSVVQVEGLGYREGLNAVGISGGIAGNVIPDSCIVSINYRFAPHRSVAQA
ncbi:MAG: succinyl-diaminopimelate desuccinylase, partial [Angustibacter sp.]